MTATKIDSSHESDKNFITWAWTASTTIIYNYEPCIRHMKKKPYINFKCRAKKHKSLTHY
jgi:hypothetical protein